MSTLRFGNVSFETSNEDRVYFPHDGITKADLISYYRKVAEVMLPHLRERPLSFQRFPSGIDKQGFFQKDAPEHYPEWMTRIPMKKKGGRNHHVVADKPATLAYLANNGVITIHSALSKGPDLTIPDRVIFDLDPSVDDFALIQRAAEIVREVLEDLGLATYLQTTGSRGLHVVSPIKQEHPFETVAAFSKKVAQVVVARDPDSFTIERLKENRGDRLLIDYFRNAYAQTSVAPYSVRAKAGAPVATPIEWDELYRLPQDAATFTLASVPKRLTAKGDPWKTMTRRSRSLKKPLQRLEKMTGPRDG